MGHQEHPGHGQAPQNGLTPPLTSVSITEFSAGSSAAAARASSRRFSLFFLFFSFFSCLLFTSATTSLAWGHAGDVSEGRGPGFVPTPGTGRIRLIKSVFGLHSGSGWHSDITSDTGPHHHHLHPTPSISASSSSPQDLTFTPPSPHHHLHHLQHLPFITFILLKTSPPPSSSPITSSISSQPLTSVTFTLPALHLQLHLPQDLTSSSMCHPAHLPSSSLSIPSSSSSSPPPRPPSSPPGSCGAAPRSRRRPSALPPAPAACPQRHWWGPLQGGDREGAQHSPCTPKPLRAPPVLCSAQRSHHSHGVRCC